jgi:hypothetical protein
MAKIYTKRDDKTFSNRLGVISSSISIPAPIATKSTSIITRPVLFRYAKRLGVNLREIRGLPGPKIIATAPYGWVFAQNWKREMSLGFITDPKADYIRMACAIRIVPSSGC